MSVTLLKVFSLREKRKSSQNFQEPGIFKNKVYVNVLIYWKIID